MYYSKLDKVKYAFTCIYCFFFSKKKINTTNTVNREMPKQDFVRVKKLTDNEAKRILDRFEDL